jgi:hypothetical protein
VVEAGGMILGNLQSGCPHGGRRLTTAGSAAASYFCKGTGTLFSDLLTANPGRDRRFAALRNQHLTVCPHRLRSGCGRASLRDRYFDWLQQTSIACLSLGRCSLGFATHRENRGIYSWSPPSGLSSGGSTQ